MLNVSVFDLDDIFFVFIDSCEKFSLNFGEMLSNFVFVDEARLFFED